MDDRDKLAETAALYCLGILESEESRRFEQLLHAGDRAAYADFHAFATVTAALAEFTPLHSPSPALKARLLKSIAANQHAGQRPKPQRMS